MDLKSFLIIVPSCLPSVPYDYALHLPFIHHQSIWKSSTYWHQNSFTPHLGNTHTHTHTHTRSQIESKFLFQVKIDSTFQAGWPEKWLVLFSNRNRKESCPKIRCSCMNCQNSGFHWNDSNCWIEYNSNGMWIIAFYIQLFSTSISCFTPPQSC